MLWWGYKHINGSLQAKPYFDEIDIEDAHQSPFVQIVIKPFEASGRDNALSIVEKRCSYIEKAIELKQSMI